MVKTAHKTIMDPQIGEVVFRKSVSSRNISIRVHPVKGVSVTVPTMLPYAAAKLFFNARREWILQTMAKQKEQQRNVHVATPEEIETKFGFLVEAYKYGAPPHGGSGMGLDRLVMVMAGADNLRDVIAFPKVQNASELMSKCPAPADPAALEELGIAVVAEEE